MKAKVLKVTIYEALRKFLQSNCFPLLEGGGVIGGENPKAIDCEIRIKLHEDGSGYIHVIGVDSDTKNFNSVDLTEKTELDEAIEHINALVDKYGLSTDSLISRKKRDALAFLLKHDKYYLKLKGKQKEKYAENFINP